MRAVDGLDGAGRTIDDALFLVGRGELDAVAGERAAAVDGVDLVILAELSPRLPHGQARRYQPSWLRPGGGSDEPPGLARDQRVSGESGPRQLHLAARLGDLAGQDR